MKRARLIYNPTAGREMVKKNLAYILSEIESAGYETSTHATTGKWDAMKEAEKACENDFDLIIAAGGDGTLYEVINGMSGKNKRSKLAVLPFGTSNDFARSLGIPKTLEGALEIIKQGKTEMVDVGKANDRYFINIAGGGVLTELTYEVPSKLKTAIGQLAYYVKGIEKLPSFKPYNLTYEVDGKINEEKAMLFLVANSKTVGGFDKLAPDAKINDGLLDVFILKKCNLVEMARVAGLLLAGEHVKDPKIIHFQTNEITFKLEEEVMLNLDGELGGKSPCVFKILPRHIEFFVNEDVF